MLTDATLALPTLRSASRKTVDIPKEVDEDTTPINPPEEEPTAEVRPEVNDPLSPPTLEKLPKVRTDEQWLNTTYEKLKEAQRDENDPMSWVIDFMETGILEDELSITEKKITLAFAKTCTIKNGLLYYVSETPYHDVRRGPVRRALYVPESFRRRIMTILHDDLFSGHFGYDKMRPTLMDRFWWPTMHDNLKDHIKSCETCNMSKDIPRKIGFYRPVPIGENPWERVGIDILGPLKESNQGNKYVVVLTDYFTRWADAFAVPAIDALTVAKIIVEQCFCRFGIPLVLHSDQGQPFISSLMPDDGQTWVSSEVDWIRLPLEDMLVLRADLAWRLSRKEYQNG
jgi:hypothetical protein